MVSCADADVDGNKNMKHIIRMAVAAEFIILIFIKKSLRLEKSNDLLLKNTMPGRLKLVDAGGIKSIQRHPWHFKPEYS